MNDGGGTHRGKLKKRETEKLGEKDKPSPKSAASHTGNPGSLKLHQIIFSFYVCDEVF